MNAQHELIHYEWNDEDTEWSQGMYSKVYVDNRSTYNYPLRNIIIITPGSNKHSSLSSKIIVY